MPDGTADACSRSRSAPASAACLTDDGVVIEIVGDLEIEKLAQRSTPDGRADDVLSARGLADRLGVATADLRTVIDEDRVAPIVLDHGRRLGAFLAPVVDELTVDLVVVGGGLVAAFDRFGAALRDALGRPVRTGRTRRRRTAPRRGSPGVPAELTPVRSAASQRVSTTRNDSAVDPSARPLATAIDPHQARTRASIASGSTCWLMWHRSAASCGRARR